MRLGLLGGSFDPIHYGHLLMAETCREAARLDRVWFVPAATSPHKQGRTTAEARHRIQMLRLAIGGYAAFEVCEWEVERGGLSYTVETLQHVHAEHPQAELFFLMGADSLRDFPTWREPERICRLATPLVVSRPDAPPPDLSTLVPFLRPEQFETIQQHPIEMPLIQLSSSDIRDRCRQRLSIRFRTPQAVAKYVATQQLYTA